VKTLTMAFDKSVPGAGMYPAMPADMLDDDDDEIIREVKILSLVTAQEEQEHRDRLNRELNLAGKSSDPNLRSAVTLQESSSLPELVGGAGIEIGSVSVDGPGTRAVITSQIARPRPHSGRPLQGVVAGVAGVPGVGVSSGVAVVPPPLPAVPPNARSRMQTDPIRIPSPPRTVQRNRQQIPAKPRDSSAANRSQSLSPPFYRTNLESFNIPDDLPAHGTSSHDAPLICLSPPVNKFEQVESFDLKSFDPLQPHHSRQPPTITQSAVSKTVSDPVRRPVAADPKVSAYRNSPVHPYPVDAAFHWPPSPFVGGGNDLVTGGYPAVLGFMPWVTNDLVSPSGSGFPISCLPDSSGNILSGSAVVPEIPDQHIPSGSVPGSSGSGGLDLMDFSTDHGGSPPLDPVYMDLADFDPLYTLDSGTWKSEQRFESDELFLKPGGSETLPASTVSSAQRLDREHHPTVAAPLPDVVAQSSVARLTGVEEELQDPFSVQDLMVSLEKKRQRHAREQEVQDLRTAASCHRVEPAHNVSQASATASKRKV